jgi:lysophospholipase L1-like esterase
MRIASVCLVALALFSLAAGCGGNAEEATSPLASPGAGGGGGAGGTEAGGQGGEGGGSGSGGAAGAAPMTAKACFADIFDGFLKIDYDAEMPVMNSKCDGTNHQDIHDVEKVVFLGDSITKGTPPTPITGFYRQLVVDALKEKYPDIEVADCSKWGAVNRDLNLTQIPTCFPDVEPKRTLVVMTSGGNDIAALAQNKVPEETALPKAEKAVAELEKAIHFFRDDPSMFPAGVSVVFANVYEFTDTTADLDSCPLGKDVGFTGLYLEGVTLLSYMEREYLRIAVETKTDMLFLREVFCGHGFRSDFEGGQCYRGPEAETWFDFTCIHPTPAGHEVIAGMVMDVVNE